MSKFFNNTTIGIDVLSDFSYIAILEPNDHIYRKIFKIQHYVSSFNHLLKEIKKVEEAV